MQNLVYKIGSNLPETIFGKEFSDGYGTLSFQVPDIETNNDPLLFHIYIDVSGSMSDIIEYKYNRSKMQLLKHTLNNILYHFAEKCSNIYVQVKGFDNMIHDYIDTIEVTKHNINELISKLDTVHPMNSTDIGLALNSLNKEIDTKYFDIPINKRVAILLTDGEPTSGICTIPELVKIVSKDCSHHFIALGNEQDVHLMYQLGHKNVFTTNWFINEIEHTGNVYGEILFNETHRVFNNVTIKVMGGRIYDFNKGLFVDKLEIGALYEETNKNYHLMIDNEDIFNIIVSGNNERGDMYFNICVDKQFTKENEPEILKQYLRLCVQKLMFNFRQKTVDKCETIFEQQFNFGLGCNNHKIIDNPEKDNLKKDIITFYNFITKIIKDNNFENDEFMIELVKDVNVMKNSYSTIDGFQFVSAREDSQGRQTAFNTASQYEYDLNGLLPPKLKRETTSAYKTPRRCELMRNISDNTPLYIDVDIANQINEDSPLKPPRLGMLTPPELRRQLTIETAELPEIEKYLNS